MLPSPAAAAAGKSSSVPSEVSRSTGGTLSTAAAPSRNEARLPMASSPSAKPKLPWTVWTSTLAAGTQTVQAVYTAGGTYWSEWYPAIRDELLANQRSDGNWPDQFCTHYGTAMACLILQIPNNYLPILQR